MNKEIKRTKKRTEVKSYGVIEDVGPGKNSLGEEVLMHHRELENLKEGNLDLDGITINGKFIDSIDDINGATVTYVDAQDEATLNAAKDYADLVTGNESQILDDAKAYTDSEMASGKEYVDSADSNLQAQIDDLGGVGKDYVDNADANLQSQIDNLEGVGKDYVDAGDSNLQTQIDNIETVGQEYVDTADSNLQTQIDAINDSGAGTFFTGEAVNVTSILDTADVTLITDPATQITDGQLPTAKAVYDYVEGKMAEEDSTFLDGINVSEVNWGDKIDKVAFNTITTVSGEALAVPFEIDFANVAETGTDWSQLVIANYKPDMSVMDLDALYNLYPPSDTTVSTSVTNMRLILFMRVYNTGKAMLVEQIEMIYNDGTKKYFDGWDQTRTGALATVKFANEKVAKESKWSVNKTIDGWEPYTIKGTEQFAEFSGRSTSSITEHYLYQLTDISGGDGLIGSQLIQKIQQNSGKTTPKVFINVGKQMRYEDGTQGWENMDVPGTTALTTKEYVDATRHATMLDMVKMLAPEREMEIRKLIYRERLAQIEEDREAGTVLRKYIEETEQMGIQIERDEMINNDNTTDSDNSAGDVGFKLPDNLLKGLK